MPAISADFVVLGATMAAGAAIGLLHDLWLVLVLGYQPSTARRLRGAQLRPSYFAPVWLLAVGLAWVVLGAVSSGTVRGFVFIGFGLGALLYYLLLSRLVRLAMGWLKWAVSSLVRIALDALAWVVLLPWRVVCWIGRPTMALLTALLAVPAGWLLSLFEWLGRVSLTGGRRLAAVWQRLTNPVPPPPAEPPEPLDPSDPPESTEPPEHTESQQAPELPKKPREGQEGGRRRPRRH